MMPSGARLVSRVGKLTGPYLTSEGADLSEGWQRAWRISLSGWGVSSSGGARESEHNIWLVIVLSLSPVSTPISMQATSTSC